MINSRLEEELLRCPPGTKAALLSFLETGNEADLETFARGILARNIDDEYLPILEAGGEELKMVDDLGIDSLGMTEIAMNLEDALDIELIDDALKSLETLGDVKRHLLKRCAAKAQGEN